MAIDGHLETVECAWCEKNILVNVTTDGIYIDCVHCGRSLHIHSTGGFKWPIKWYTTRVTQNTRIPVYD